MELMNFIFRLGVLFAIYGFIWGIFEIGLTILSSGRKRTLLEEYIIKAVKYAFLVDVTFLFCLDLEKDNISIYNLTMAGLILLAYFVGKLQNKQNQMAMFQMMGNGFPKQANIFNMKAEIAVITLAILLFIVFIFYPDLTKNPISIWLNESIINIEDTPIFGFIFKVIGFFFLISMLVKMMNAFLYLFLGKPFMNGGERFKKTKDKKEEESFDDFEELE